MRISVIKKRQINEKNTADLKKYKKPRKMGKMETKGFFILYIS
jgi:hypothetical protein